MIRSGSHKKRRKIRAKRALSPPASEGKQEKPRPAVACSPDTREPHGVTQTHKCQVGFPRMAGAEGAGHPSAGGEDRARPRIRQALVLVCGR